MSVKKTVKAIAWCVYAPATLVLGLAIAAALGWVYVRCNFHDFLAVVQALVYAVALGSLASFVCGAVGVRNCLFAFLYGAAIGAAGVYGSWFFTLHEWRPDTLVYWPLDMWKGAIEYCRSVETVICGVECPPVVARLWYYAEAAIIVPGAMFIALGRRLKATEKREKKSKKLAEEPDEGGEEKEDLV